ncbi:MAG: phage portal protein [Polynucleobacter sp.]
MAAPIKSSSDARQVSAGAYKGGERTSRELAFWRPRLESGDKSTLPQKADIEARARDLARNNGYAAGVLDTVRDRVVGHRYRLALQPDYKRLGIDRTVLREWARHVEGLFQAYFDDPEAHIDAARRRTGVELLRAAMVSDIVAGETILTREWRESSNAPYSTCFQLIEPEKVATPIGKSDGAKLRAGVELGEYGEAIAYHIRDTHPADIADPTASGNAKFARIPRYNEAGVLNVFHLFEGTTPGHQTRGVSRFAPILQKAKQLDRYEDAELEMSIAASVYGMAIESQFGPGSALEAVGGDYFDSLNRYVDAKSEFADASPIFFDGMRVPHLFPGEKLLFQKSEHPTSAFPEFEAAMLRQYGRAVGMSYEQISGDYSRTNYSSARASMAEAWSYVLGKRTTVVSRAATLMFRAWLDEAIARGVVMLPPGITDYRAARSMLSQCLWIGAGRPVVDESKTAAANAQRLATGETTLAAICAEQGTDWEEVLEQRAEEIAVARELGVPIAGSATTAPAPDTAAPGDDAPDDTDDTDDTDAPDDTDGTDAADDTADNEDATQ